MKPGPVQSVSLHTDQAAVTWSQPVPAWHSHRQHLPRSRDTVMQMSRMSQLVNKQSCEAVTRNCLMRLWKVMEGRVKCKLHLRSQEPMIWDYVEIWGWEYNKIRLPWDTFVMTDRGIVTSSDLGTWDTIISDTGADNAGPGHRGKVSVSSVHHLSLIITGLIA